MSQVKVQHFLKTMTLHHLDRDEISLADNFFTLLNEPAHVMSGGVVPLPQEHGFSDGSGRIRNKVFVVS